VGQGSAALAVRFGAERRPEAATHIRMAEWEGPLGLLLSLIEARRLDVLDVPLGALAEAYLDALAGLDEDRIGNISSFVAIASQLILIKSRAMLPRQALELPTDDEEAADRHDHLRALL
jgi:segregation and condensation protein A